MAKTDFLTLNDLSQSALFKVLERAHAQKGLSGERIYPVTVTTCACHDLREVVHPDTRQFEAGMTQLGGSAIFYLRTIHNSGAENLSKTPRACCLKW